MGTLTLGLFLVVLAALLAACSCGCLERFYPEKSRGVIAWVDTSVLKQNASKTFLTAASVRTSVKKVHEFPHFVLFFLPLVVGVWARWAAWKRSVLGGSE